MKPIDDAALTFALGYLLYILAGLGWIGWTVGRALVTKVRERRAQRALRHLHDEPCTEPAKGDTVFWEDR